MSANSGATVEDNKITFQSKHSEDLFQKISAGTARVGIIGLGYVGLPLTWTFFEKGFQVLGFDVDEEKIRHFENGTSYIRHFGLQKMSKMAESERCEATEDFSRARDVDVIIICVPTPLTENREPDMSFVKGTLNSIGPHLRQGQLVILESTTYPGTTEELVRPICEALSGLRSGDDIFFAFSPEREDPGNQDYETATIPKVVGAEGSDALLLAEKLYSTIVVETVTVSDTRTAEAVKLLENIFRSVNIALVNELKIAFQKMNIDIYEVIDAAKTKPFGFMPFYPGPGLGGHCIPIDPFYLAWKAKEFGVDMRFIELAGEINTNMPRYVISNCIDALSERGKKLKGCSVLCMGLAYKPDLDDDRESPTYVMMDLLDDKGATVDYHDPFIPVIRATREHAKWAGKASVRLNRETVSKYDLVIILTKHSKIDYGSLAEWASCVVDTRNAIPVKGNADLNHVWHS